MSSPLSHLTRAVIAITEAKCDQSVVSATRRLAALFGAEVYLLRVDPPAGVDPGQKLAWLLSEDEGLNRLAAAGPISKLEQIEQKTIFEDVRWIRVEASDTSSAVLQFVREQGADLVVLETHVSHGLGRGVFGGTANEIARWSTCPVLSIPREWARIHDDRPPGHILAPIDFSDPSLDGLRTALLLADRYRSRLSALFVKEEAIVTRIRGGRIRREVRRVRPEGLRAAESALREICERESAAYGIDVEVLVRAGSPASEILDTATGAQTGLVVISSHGITAESRYALGSVCDRVMRRAACPVLVLKSDVRSNNEG